MDIKGFIESSMLDWPGEISSIIFTAGCNFRCGFCHNKDLVLVPNEIDTIPEEYILDYISEHKKWIDGLVITGGEPTLQKDLLQFIKKVKSIDCKVKLDTNGTNPKVLKDLLDNNLVDYIAMDIKTGLSTERYSNAIGVDCNIDLIKESVNLLLDSKNIKCEFRTTLVPGLVEEEDLYNISDMIKDAMHWTWQKFRPMNTLNESMLLINPYPDDIVEKWEKNIRAKFKNPKTLIVQM